MELQMQTILERAEEGGRVSHIAFAQRAISANYERELLAELDRMDDFRGGTSSFGPIPRLQKWYNMGGEYFAQSWADQGNPRWTAMPEYEPFLLELQQRMQALADGAEVAARMRRATSLNSCLLNKYRDGRDSIKPHRDSEEIFGEDPTVLVLSLGAARSIVFERIVYDPHRPKSIKPERALPERFEIELASGSLLVMGGTTQKYYSHAIQKCKSAGVRYSLTFREFKPQS